MSILKNVKIVRRELTRGLKRAKKKINGEYKPKHKKKDTELSDFIKENIINKAPEYPEYDKATAESTMAELLSKANQVKKETTENKLSNDTIKYIFDQFGIRSINTSLNSYEENMKIINKHIDKFRGSIEFYRSLDSFHYDNQIKILLDVARYVDIFRHIENIYIINGPARAGKDTFIEYVNKAGFPGVHVRSISSVQGIKNISAKYFGYDDKNKTDKDRKFLSDFKALTTEYCNYSLNNILEEILIADIERCTHIFIHIREPEEIDKCKGSIDRIMLPHISDKLTSYKYYKYNDKLFMKAQRHYMVKTIFIGTDREIEKVTNNNSDLNVDKYNYGYYIANDGTLKDLENIAYYFIKKEIDISNEIKPDSFPY